MFILTYSLPGKEISELHDLNCDTLEEAIATVNAEIDGLRFFGAYDFHICNTSGLIIYRFEKYKTMD